MINTNIDEEQLKAIITEAVDIREKGDAILAGGMLTEVIDTAYDNCLDLICAQALSQRIICSKHLYQNEGLDIYLNKMVADIHKGLQLNISPENHAVFYLRYGDVFASTGDHQSAEDYYREAYERVPKGGKEEAEYLGHLAEALVDNAQGRVDKFSEAVFLVKRGLAIMQTIPESEIEDWHRLIIVSGLYGRLARSAVKTHDFKLAFGSLWSGYKMARKLAYQYQRPQRLNQFYLRLRGKVV